MSQAFFTSIGGISAAQSKIDVIADNIANMNTVAFKSSSLNFQNVYSRIISSGSAPSSQTGGTDPQQVGLGVTVGSISKNFTSGTIQSTGKSSDLNIQGNGYFTLQGPEGMLLTRAGNFTLDANGSLVTADGTKVYGTDSISGLPSDVNATAKIPITLKMTVAGKDLAAASADGTDTIADLNNANITEGTFTVKISNGAVPATVYDVPVDITGCTKLSEIATKINDAITSFTDSDSNPVFTDGEDPPVNSVTASVNTDGTFSLSYDPNLTGNPSAIQFVSGTSNFPSETGLSSAASSITSTTTFVDDVDEEGNPIQVPVITDILGYKSNVLSYTATIAEGNPGTDPTKTAFSISNDGAIEASYSNGDKITVEANDAGTKKELIYKTSAGVIIKGSDINVASSTIIDPSNLQLRLASVVNEQGLMARGSNTFSVGPNCGNISYSVGNSNGMGKVASGGLEASNVDLPTEFAQMILSQRAIDANSRTFSAMNQIMQSVVNLGRG